MVDVQNTTGKISTGLGKQLSTGKQLLALDALSRLARQFASKPDFCNLMSLLNLTISGQFSVSSTFITLYDLEKGSGDPIFSNSGKFKNNTELSSVVAALPRIDFLEKLRSPWYLDESKVFGDWKAFGIPLYDCGVRLLVPLVQEDELVGLVGLGEKVNKKEFPEAEIELLMILLNTITPLLVNSFLFMKIDSLNVWYRDILKNVKMGIFVFDKKNRLKSINEAGGLILKNHVAKEGTPGIMIEAPMEQIFNENVFPGWSEHLLNVKGKQSLKLFEHLRAKGIQGEKIYNVYVSTTGSDGDDQSDLIVTLDDITLQKQNERRLFDLEKFAEKGMMASSIAHELNNFLGLILGGVEIAQYSLGAGNTQKTILSLDKIKTNIKTMERFTTGLMDYAILNSGMTRTCLNSLIIDVVAFVKFQKGFNNIKVVTDFEEQLQSFDLDPDQISQLLLNFLNNAADAIGETNRKDGVIKIKTEKIDKEVILSISDNGVGIKPDVKEKLFKNQFTTKEKGHGYGLVTCYKIIENHNAKVNIETEPGYGSTFTIRFPLEEK